MITSVAPTLAAVLALLLVWVGGRAGRAIGAAAVGRWRTRASDLLAARLVEHGVAALLGLSVATTVTPIAPPSSAATTGPGEPAPEPATMRPLTPSIRPAVPAAAAVDQTWTIAPGDHLWGLSHRALEVAFGRTPTDTEIADYVSEVIERNRHVFVVRANPDLVFPGQVFARPPLPAG
jgi:nucleoid-associated protein YgaU